MIKRGDVLFFYMSKHESYAASQSITTIGIAEQVINVSTVDDLVRHTAKRSVFSADELDAMTPSPSSPVKVIDFLFIGHLQPAVPLSDLLAQGVFNNRPPQSVAELGETRYKILKPSLHIGFDL